MKKKSLVALFLLSLLGLAVAIVLTKMHYRMGEMGLEEKSFCNVSDFIDCDSVLASRYAKVGRFLNAELAILYYVLVGFGILYAGLTGEGKATLAYLFVSSILAVLYSAYMAYISLYKLGVICLLCTTSYAANLGLMLLFPVAMGLRYREIPTFLIHYVRSIVKPTELKPKLGLHLGATVVLTIVGLIFFNGLNPQIHEARAEVPRDVYLKIFSGVPVKKIDLAGRPSWGKADAKVTVVEFSDFQCPFCRRAAFTLKPYLKEFRDDVRFVFMNFPLDAACNPAIEHSMHPVSCIAAKSVLCADKQGKFWEMHDEIFENQKRLSRSILLQLASKVGLERASFEKCLASEEISEVLKKDVDEGNRLEVRGTPAIYINGRAFRDWLDPERLRMVIESEAGRTGR